MKMAKSIEEYIENQDKFGDSLIMLRDIMLSTEMVETVKWGMPAYMINNKNVLGISAFKNYFGVWFFNGVFLSDPHNILLNAQEGKTKALRQLHFSKIEEINKSIILDYVYESIDNQKKGLEIKPVKKRLEIPKELSSLLAENKKLGKIFGGLSSGKKKEFSEYISEAKREDTKIRRLEKIVPMILNNIGLNDKYR